MKMGLVGRQNQGGGGSKELGGAERGWWGIGLGGWAREKRQALGDGKVGGQFPKAPRVSNEGGEL